MGCAGSTPDMGVPSSLCLGGIDEELNTHTTYLDQGSREAANSRKEKYCKKLKQSMPKVGSNQLLLLVIDSRQEGAAHLLFHNEWINCGTAIQSGVIYPQK